MPARDRPMSRPCSTTRPSHHLRPHLSRPKKIPAQRRLQRRLEKVGKSGTYTDRRILSTRPGEIPFVPQLPSTKNFATFASFSTSARNKRYVAERLSPRGIGVGRGVRKRYNLTPIYRRLAGIRNQNQARGFCGRRRVRWGYRRADRVQGHL